MGRGRDGGEIGAPPLQRLLESGAVGALSDEELLARFARRDASAELAFEVLVRRHGPMVLRVCRGVLGDWHDAQDAFQATFLVLARKAGSIRRGDALGAWLHGVARRVAWRAREDASRRRLLERVGAELAGDRRASAAGAGAEAEPVEIREELERLPERYRLALELCYLGGLTHEEAASRLRWPVGTVRSRLARGRATLRARLAGRGLAVPAALLAGTAAARARAESLPTDLADSTLRAVLTPSQASSKAVALMKGALAAMTRIRILKAAALAVSAGLLAVGAALARPQPQAKPPADAPQARPAAGPATPDQLQGSWVRVATEADGRVIWKADGKTPPPRLVVRGNLFDFGGDGKNVEAFVLFPGETPPRIGLTPQSEAAGPLKGQPYFGRYRLEGDTLTLCLKIDRSGVAPEGFATKPGDRLVVDVYRRERPAGKAVEDPVRADLAKLQGTWYRVASQAGGKDWMPRGSIDPRSPALAVVFDGDQWRGLDGNGNPTPTQHTITLDPDARPKRMQLGIEGPDGPGKQGYRAIYKIEGNTLTLCIQFNSELPAPAEFATKEGDGRVLDVYVRARP